MNTATANNLPSSLTWDNKNITSLIKEGYELPAVFTLKSLREEDGYVTKYVTLYARVHAAIQSGVIAQIGKFRDHVRPGSYETVYARRDVKLSAPLLQESLGERGEFKSFET